MSGDPKIPKTDPSTVNTQGKGQFKKLFKDFQPEAADVEGTPALPADAEERRVELQPDGSRPDSTSVPLQPDLSDTQPNQAKSQTARRKFSIAGWKWSDWFDMILVTAGGLLLLVLALAPETTVFLTPLRWFVGILFALIAPGYCLTLAIFSHADDLDSLERAGLSLGLSVALVPVLALALNWLPIGLSLRGILLAELLSCAVFLAIAAWQRGRLPASEAYLPRPRRLPHHWWLSQKRADRIAYAVAIPVLILTLLVTVVLLQTPSADQNMTEFFILGESGLAESYPRQARLGETQTVTMGINNQEKSENSYWVEARQGLQLVGVGGPFVLKPGDEITAPLDFILTESGEDVQVVFILHRGNDETPYRTLELWLEVVPK